MVNNINLKSLFTALDEEMLHNLSTKIDEIKHPCAKGSEIELNWIGLLRKYLPTRYCIDSGFILDSNGNCSEQIDLIIYDRHFTPFIFKGNSAIFVPAEGVYAVFEIKPTLNTKNCNYAIQKVESARKLFRTSVSFTHIKGTDKKELFEILGGILTSNSKYKYIKSDALKKFYALNFILSLEKGIIIDKKIIEKNVKPILSTFILTLIKKLRELGSVPALDIDEYLNKT